MNTGLPARLCPHSVYEFDCTTPKEPHCQTCQMYIEARAKMNKENERIADGIRSVWQEQQNMSTDWRG